MIIKSYNKLDESHAIILILIFIFISQGNQYYLLANEYSSLIEYTLEWV
jgi:hypothetical protein